MKKKLAWLLALSMVLTLSTAAYASDAVTDLPREETIYFGGQQWGPIIGWNPLSSNMNNAMAIAAAASPAHADACTPRPRR